MIPVGVNWALAFFLLLGLYQIWYFLKNQCSIYHHKVSLCHSGTLLRICLLGVLCWTSPISKISPSLNKDTIYFNDKSLYCINTSPLFSNFHLYKFSFITSRLTEVFLQIRFPGIWESQIIPSAITQHVHDNQGIKPSHQGSVKSKSCLSSQISCEWSVDVVYLDLT